ncbi:MAG: hypothetical protein ACKO6L_01265 [Flavobacteriales bacterium]
MHQNGRDTHVRQVKIFGPRDYGGGNGIGTIAASRNRYAWHECGIHRIIKNHIDVECPGIVVRQNRLTAYSLLNCWVFGVNRIYSGVIALLLDVARLIVAKRRRNLDVLSFDITVNDEA